VKNVAVKKDILARNEERDAELLYKKSLMMGVLWKYRQS
jgi:hypothetical protein